VLRQFRRATAAERALAVGIADELRGVDYKAAGTLQRGIDPAGQMSRGEWDGLLGALAQAGLVAMEEAEYEKDGEVRRYRKVRLTDAGRELRAGWANELLLSDGVVEEFGGRGAGTARGGKEKAGPAKTGSAKNGPAKGAGTNDGSAAPVRLTAEGEAVAARLRAWRAAEAKRLGVPAYVLLHDRTVIALAGTRPGNARELLTIDGIGPAKVEKFGAAILGLCSDVPVR
jgi:superfamily II DNA helicase RecQ